MNHINSTPDKEPYCERCEILSGELMQRDHDIKSNSKNVRHIASELIKITTAHHEMDMTLANLERSQEGMDDPEMMSSLVNASLKKFFKDAGYFSTVTYLENIKVNH